MKIHIRNLCIALAAFAGIYQANSAVTFTITPSAISNTYSGPITLNITGITAGDTVVVQKFLDADSNSVIDSSCLLWQQFQITDGQAAVFTNGTTSVTNFNIPCDTDGSANGSITASLFPSMDFAQTIAGKYFFEVSSPAGHFSPVTNSFLVTSFPFAQSISGNVVNNGTNVPNAVVILFAPSNGNGQNPQGGALADSLGAYKIAAPPGTYVLGAVRTNYVANLGAAPALVLNQGTFIITNVPLTNATESISGRIVDANTAAGIAGYLVPFQTDGGLLAIAFTDTNGSFTVGVTSDLWKLGNNSASLLVKGYLSTQNSLSVDTTTGSVSSVTESLTKESAIFYGKVTDNFGNPLTGVDIYGSDDNNLYQSDGLVYTNGNYVTSAVGGSGDLWQLQYDHGGPANFVYSQPQFNQNGGTNIHVGQAILVNFTGLPTTNIISGNVQDSNGDPVAGLGVNASATIDNVSYNVHADTDDNGNYSFNVANGYWDVSVNCGSGGDGLEDLYPGGNAECPADDYVTIDNDNGPADFLVELTGCTLGVTTASLPDGLAGSEYDVQLQSSGCYSPFTWSLTPGSLPLPDGLTLSTNGDISGVPTTEAAVGGTTNYFSVEVADSQGDTADAFLSITIYPALTIANMIFPKGTNGVPYSAQVSASGGNAFTIYGEPDGYSLLENGTLPPGLNVSYGTITVSNEYFVVSGTPTNTGTYNFMLGAEDADDNIVENNYSITIVASALQIGTTSLVNATVGLGYTNQLKATGGNPPYTWAIALGSQPLPSGLSLSAGGIISGVPAASGSFTFIVRVTDSSSVTTTRSLTLVVNSGASSPVISSPAYPSQNLFQMKVSGSSGQSYTVQMSTNVLSGNWAPLLVTNPPSSSFLFIDPNATNKQRFYRVLETP